MLDLIREYSKVPGFSLYEANAKLWKVYDGPIGGFKKSERGVGKYAMVKAQVLALGFQCGWEKYIKAAYDMAGYDVTQHDDIDPATGEKIYGSAAQREVKFFRDSNPEIVNFWGTLDRGFKSSLGSDFVVELPTGRKMTYRKVRRESRKTWNPKTEKFEQKFVYTAEAKGRREIFYGGLLAENATQATARELFMEYIHDLHKAKLCPLWRVYDEAVCEVDMDVKTQDIEQIMSRTPEWLTGCPVGAEAQEAMHYKK